MTQFKSTFTRENKIFLALLRKEREGRGVTQVELAKRLGQTQTFISKCERGERRIDVIELSRFCHEIGIGFPEFVTKLEGALENDTSRPKSRKSN